MSREDRLTEAFVALADTLVADYDVVERGQQLVDYCVELLDVDGAGIMLVGPDRRLQTLAASSERLTQVEMVQLRTGRGPCVQCFATGSEVAESDLRTSRHWPQFTAAALAAGYHSVHALPLRLRTETLGAMNLFRRQPGSLSAADRRAGQGMADIATIGILQERAVSRGTALTEQLQGALTSRVLVEQAKGVIAARADMDMDAAFGLLRRFARQHNRRLAEAARAVIEGSVDIAGLDDVPPVDQPT